MHVCMHTRLHVTCLSWLILGAMRSGHALHLVCLLLDQVGLQHHEQPTHFDAQAAELKDMFEEVNGMKDCLQRCVTGMGPPFKKSHISRQLKAMGLKRNRLTDAQVLAPYAWNLTSVVPVFSLFTPIAPAFSFLAFRWHCCM